MDIEHTIKQALDLHQAGQLPEAENLYHAVLEQQPAHADALHLLGLVRFAHQEYLEAIHLIRCAIDIAPNNAVYYFNLGNAYRAQNELDAAAAAYQGALSRQMDEADYHNNLGEVLETQGKWLQACECYARAVALQADDVTLQLNLARAHLLLGQANAALTCYRRAAALAPDAAWIQLDLGACLQHLGQLDAAAQHYRQALALQADMAQASNNLGGIHHARGELAEAARCYRAALASDPDLAEAHRNLAAVLEQTDERDAAVQHYREALRLKPDYAEAAFKLAALQGEAAPASAPPEYVASLFDQYAEEFDAHLTDTLGYRTPQALREVLDTLAPQATRLQVLDLGCGTGLSGMAFRDCAAWLCGVDLSPRMIAKAQARGIYDALQVGEVLEVLQAEAARWDLIVAADVFVYLGDLSPVLQSTVQALRPNGWLLFSVEQATPTTRDFTLHAAGRYAHNPAYLRHLAADAGLRVCAEQATVLRQDQGRDVSGCLFALRKRAAQ